MNPFSSMRSPIRWPLMPILAAAMLVFALASSFKSAPAKTYNPRVAPPASVFDEQVAGLGITEPKSETISIGTTLPGIVRSVQVTAGQPVKAGDVLFVIDDRDAAARLETAKVQLEAARIEAEDAKHQLGLYTKVKDPRAVSDDERSRRKFAAELAAARARQAEAQVKVIQTELDRLSVKAPVDGTVLKVNVRPGEYAQTGPASDPLLLMGDISAMYVRVQVDEADALLVQFDSKAVGTIRGYPERRTNLTFVRKEAYVQPKRSLSGDGSEKVDTRVQDIIYAFDNAQVGAFVGQQMDIFIEAKERAPEPVAQ